MAKLYFREDDDGSCCYLKEDILEQMKELLMNILIPKLNNL